MRTNLRLIAPAGRTHEGGTAARETAKQQLKRSVMTCLLWEDGFYEDGVEIATRILDLARQVSIPDLCAIAVDARHAMFLRHVPLLLSLALIERGRGDAVTPEIRHQIVATIASVLYRADEPGELISMYKALGGKTIPRLMKQAINAALPKFNEYMLAKYSRRGDAVTTRDVLRICRPKPANDEQSALWKGVVARTLATPDTWETALSSGADKAATWRRLLRDKKLGGLAALRNLRNMQQAGLSVAEISDGLRLCDYGYVLPFRFIAAARHAPALEPVLEELLFKKLEADRRGGGNTIILVDVSGSMDNPMSEKSDMRFIDAACGVAMVGRELFENVRVFSFSNALVEVAPRRGFALRDAIVQSQAHGGTYLGAAIAQLPPCDRLIVITDEQSADAARYNGHGFIVDVAANQKGVSNGTLTRINGFSENIFRYIAEVEATRP